MSKRNNYVGGGTIIKNGSFTTHDPAEGVKEKPKIPKWFKKRTTTKNEPDKYLKEEKRINVALKGMEKTHERLKNIKYDENGLPIIKKKKPIDKKLSWKQRKKELIKRKSKE